jgi:hydroxylamine reductase (hybrid-cluster protein)
VPTQVRITPVKGKAVLISGHDMTNLEELLKQTEGKVRLHPHCDHTAAVLLRAHQAAVSATVQRAV